MKRTRSFFCRRRNPERRKAYVFQMNVIYSPYHIDAGGLTPAISLCYDPGCPKQRRTDGRRIMCGICGFVHREQADEKLLTEMIDEIRYRGPDDAGTFLENLESGYQIGLAHRRLAILDLSADGHQPMESEDGVAVITFNGEIYNFKELRSELQLLGHSFRSGTDTEVILAACRQWGIDAVSRFNGMFAFCLYDREKQTVWLVRDRMGVKPLYYAVDGNNLVFASELKPLLRYPGFRREIDRDALTLYLAAEYIPGEQSIYQQARKLLPGEMLKWTPEGMEKRRYWSVRDVVLRTEPYTGDYGEAMEELDALIGDAVRLRMISDVPLGAFLSNGVDSSLMTAKMQRLSPTPVRTFTVGFREEEYDESERAAAVAAFLGTEHHTRILSVEEGKSLFRQLPLYYDEPLADPSMIATMLVSAAAKEHVTAAVSGDAGDELFCGYNTYARFQQLKKLARLSRLLNGAEKLLPIRELGERLNSRVWVKLFHLTDDEEIIDADLYAWLDRYRGLTDGAADLTAFRDAMPLGTSLEDKAMLHDLTSYLPDDILTKVDRASMAVSLETRAPLLDYRVVEFALRLPLEYKLRNGEKKRILKDLLYREVPASLIGQKKMGFRIPFARWLREDFSEMVRWYFSAEFLRKQDLFDEGAVRKMLKRYEKSDTPDFAREVWTFLIFQMWYETYLI